MNSIFSENLRRLRQAKGYTQEQVSDHLGVRPQSVSRWECGSTFPDILLLPAIAELYCVTIDDLFRESANAYKHYADRLSSLYQSTRDRDDFIRADNEYRRLLDSDKYTTEDLRSYACIHIIAMWECVDKAMLAFDQIIAKGAGESPTTFYRARQQKMQLFRWLGQNDKNIEQQRAALATHPEEPWEHVLLLSALCDGKAHEEAWQQFCASVNRHPGTPELYVYGATACRGLGRKADAFALLDKGLALEPGLHDAGSAKARWLEEDGLWAQAAEVWSALTVSLESRGFVLEAREPRENAEACRRNLQK